MFVHPRGRSQIIFNFMGIALTGPPIERNFGRPHWMMLFFIPGLVGEFAGYVWNRSGGGASVALAG